MKQLKTVLLFWCLLLLLDTKCVSKETTSSVRSLDSHCQEEENQKYEPNFYLPVKLAGKWGFINTSGAIVVEPQFTAIHSSPSFSEGRAVVETSTNRFRFISTTGDFLTKDIFEDAVNFIHGYAAVKLDGKWGFIDHKGKLVITPQFTQVSPFFQGRAFVKLNNLWGVIDTNGSFIVKPKFSSYTNFSEGLSAVSWNENGNYRTGFISRNGEIAVKLITVIANTEGVGFRRGMIAVYSEDDKKWGFVNHKGEIVIPLKYQAVLNFEGCLAAVKLENKWGFIDVEGRVVIPPRFESLLDISSFTHGLMAVKSNLVYGYVDNSGAFVINPQFLQARSFHHGLAAVQDSKEGKWGYIDKTGKFLINPLFDKAYDFKGNIAQVETNGKIGYISRTGKYIWNPTN